MDRIAGAPPLADYTVGQQVMTREGYPGKVTDILEGPGDVTYWVTLDHHMGGGEYDEGEIWPENNRATGSATAAEDYPEIAEVLAERLPPQITSHAGAAWTHADDDDYDDDLNYPMYARMPRNWPTEDEEVAEQKRQIEELNRAQAAAKIALTLPLDPQKAVDGERAQRTPAEQEGYTTGMRDGKAGVTRNFRGNLDPDWRAGYDAGWSFGVQTSRSTPAHELEEEQRLEDEQVVAKDPVIASSSEPILIEAGALWDVIKGNEEPYKGYLSYDWCRYRRDNSCYYSKNLNVEASQQMGYAVWVPEDRGSCWRVRWKDQQACPMGMPGPHVPGGFTNATVPFEEGGQRGGAPTETFRQSALEPSALDLGWHFTAAWRDVQAKAKRIRADGGVRVIAFQEGHVVGHVKGDTNVYETELVPMPGRRSVAMWHCGCKWAAYSWGRSGPWKKYEGRMCSHALALSYEVASRGAHGREVTLDSHQPDWMDVTIPVRTPNSYDRDKGRYSSLGEYAATLRPVYDQSDDDRPIVPFVAGLMAEGVRYVDIKVFAQRLGVEDVPALVKQARKVAPFVAKVWGQIVQLFIDEEGVVRNVKNHHPVAVKDVLFPGYDPVRGLPFEHTASLEVWSMSSSEWVGKAHTLSDAASFMLYAARRAEPETTSTIQTVARRFGGEMEGLDNRFKTHKSLLRKMTAEQGGRSVGDTAMGMSDSLRYTVLFPPNQYTEGVKHVIDALAGAGYGVRTKNYWARGDAYNGINVALTSPSGHPVEVQFHTPASIAMKLDHVHPLYEAFRESKDPWQRSELADKMTHFYDSIPQPPDVMSIQPIKTQSRGLFDFPAPRAAALGGSGYRFMLTDGGQILRLSSDHATVDLWTDEGWVHSPDHAGYEFMGEVTAEDISEGDAEDLIRRSGIRPVSSLTTELHDEPEPALPTTDGADEDEDYWEQREREEDEWAHQHSEQARADRLRQLNMDLYGVPYTPGTHEDPHHASIATEIPDPGMSGVGPQQGVRDVDASLETPAVGSEMARGAELVARLDEWNAIVAAGGTPGFEHPFAQHGGGRPGSVDGEIMAAAQAFAAKTAVRTYSTEERQVFIKEGEDEMAGNLDRLDIAGTHYEALEAAQAKASSVSDDEDLWMLDGDPNG